MTTTCEPFVDPGTTDNTELCCGNKSSKARGQKVHSVPGLLTTAPYFSGVAIVDLKMRDLTLAEYKGLYLVLLFYPYDFTFICPTEMIQFNDRIEEFRKIDCEVMAISTDSQYVHLAWIMTPRKQGGLGDMKIAILSDKSQRISKMYGVLDEEEGICHKALFIIDTNQLIRHITVTDATMARSVDETLRILEGCKFVDEYGTTCPAGPRERLPSADGEPNFFSI